MFPELTDTSGLLQTAYEQAIAYLGSERGARPHDPKRSHDLLDTAMPVAGTPAAVTIARLVEAGTAGIQPTTDPTAFGYVFGGTLPVGIAADWLTTVWDQVAITYNASPVTAQAEKVCERWLVDLLGLPANTVMGLTSGCTSANLVGLAAGREAQLRRFGWDVNRDGMQDAPGVAVILSEQTHASVPRCLHLLGLSGQMHYARTDEEGRIDATHARQIARRQHGKGVIIIGQVGATDGGSIDPITQLSEIRDECGGWLHLDAAFGMWAAASPELRPLVTGLEKADSWSTDGHKWLNCPYDCGMVFCAHPEVLARAMAIGASYLDNTTSTVRHPMNYRMEVSQRARALPLWATLHHLGKTGVAQLIQQGCAAAQCIAQRLEAEPGIRILAPVRLNQVLVHVGSHTLTQHVAERLAAERVGWFTTTTWKGQPALRVSVSSWQTTVHTAEQVAEGFVRIFREANEGNQNHD
ncbi:pyridoxal phosphate-dependent decarboxylase family protein [Streptomyces shenzhenensis]|uniref:pyridoxal phosphate-dependent decarboxylase family protein n=1 Tax=Streptomyces shenzhenensis TaxID=943815 RepID=UPI0037F54DBE